MSEVGKPAARTALIVITYNSRKFFARLAASIAVQTDQNFQLVVWDNGSRKTERPLAADFLDGAVIVQCEENIGFASANNRAAELVESEFIVLLNPDAFPEADWLATLVETANHWPDTGGVGSTQIMDEDPTRYDGLGDCYYAAGIAWRGGYGWPRRSLVNDGTEAFSACAAAALYRRMAWDAVGGFDERFFAYCEDVDLGFRLRLAGWRIRQAARAVVRHVGGGTSGKQSDFAIFYGTRNRLWTFAKCMPTGLAWLLLPAHVAMTFAFLGISPFRGTGPATWRGVGAAIVGIMPVLHARRNVQRSRKASTATMAWAFTWNPIRLVRRQPSCWNKSA
ncbi:MAG: glycosyltransferase family 2 protein [Xanthobacteraceae bacterium]